MEVNTQAIEALRGSALKALATRKKELAGPQRQRYTTLPYGTYVYDTYEAAREAATAFAEQSHGKVIYDDPEAIVFRYLWNNASMERDIRIKPVYHTRYFFVR